MLNSWWAAAVSHRELSLVLRDDLEAEDVLGREAQEGVDICIHIADSLLCTAETNTKL